jgi:hypothetical protein
MDDAARRQFDLGLPDQPFALRFAWSPGVTVTRDAVTPAGDARTVMAIGGRVALHVALERPAAAAPDAAARRDAAAEEAPRVARSPVQDLRRWSVGPVACFQMRLPRFRGGLDRVERWCFVEVEGLRARLQLLWEFPPADADAALDGWTASIALVERGAPPPSDALVFARSLRGSDAPDARARALPLLDVAVGGCAALSRAERVLLGLACADAWIEADRAGEALTLLDALLAEQPLGRLHYARARVSARSGRLDDWEASLRAAFAAPPEADVRLPDPAEEPDFYCVPADRFDAVLATLARAK